MKIMKSMKEKSMKICEICGEKEVIREIRGMRPEPLNPGP